MIVFIREETEIVRYEICGNPQCLPQEGTFVYLFLYLISKYFVYIRYKNRYIHTYIDGLDRQIDRESLLHAGLMNTDIYN